MPDPWRLYDELIEAIPSDVVVAAGSAGIRWCQITTSEGGLGMAYAIPEQSRPATYLEPSLAGARLRDIAAEPFILFDEAFQLNQIILDGCERNGFRPRVAARSGQMDFIIGLVEAGMGVALLPRLMVADHHTTAARVLLDEPDMVWRMALVWRRGGYLSHAARAWLDIAREVHGGPAEAPASSE